MNIILIGPQGCGKGTQAQLLAQKFALKHISTGDLIRAGIEQKDPTALKIQTGIAEGKLAPDKLVLKLIKTNLVENNLFDGVPRTLAQAEALDELIQIDLVIELKLDDSLALKRLSSRKQCSKCRSIFGEQNPPKKVDICDNCGGKLITRDDDKPEAIKKRLATYHDETEPLIEYYKPRNIVRAVDASKPINLLFNDICALIETVV